MKTFEEVKDYISSHRFILADTEKIMGFLLGKGVIAKGEVVIFNRTPKHLSTFDEFYAWFEDDDTRLEELMNFLQGEQDKAIEKGDFDKANKLASYLGFLVEELELEYDEEDEF